MERSPAKDAERHRAGNNPPYPEPPTNAPSVHWLEDFMLREGIIRDSVAVPGDRPRLGRPQDEKRDAPYAPTQQDRDDALPARRFPAVAGMAALLGVLGLAGLAYIWLSKSSREARPHRTGITIAQPARRTETVAARPPSPEPLGASAAPGRVAEQPARRTAGALSPSKAPPADGTVSIGPAPFGNAPSPLWPATAAGFPGYPQQAFGPPPDALSDGTGALMMTAALSGVTRLHSLAQESAPSSGSPATETPSTAAAAHRSDQPPTLEQAALAPAPPIERGAQPVVPKHAAPQTTGSASGQSPSPPAQPAATAAAGNDRPAGPALHLQIVYASWGPQAAKSIAALQARIQSQMKDIATAGASEWPVRHELVIYFFPDDRAAAGRVAASLAQITKRAPPVMLLRTKSAPPPGTVDILLPLRSGEDLNNDKL